MSESETNHLTPVPFAENVVLRCGVADLVRALSDFGNYRVPSGFMQLTSEKGVAIEALANDARNLPLADNRIVHACLLLPDFCS